MERVILLEHGVIGVELNETKFEIKKSAKLIIFLIKREMSLEVCPTSKTRKIIKPNSKTLSFMLFLP